MPLALADRLNAVLPQTQCTRCGYPDCAAYARAMADGQAAINQCPPGGAQGIERLARLTGQAPLPLNPAHGQEGPRLLALIDEAWCIGCTKCLAACPTDAIVGGHKRMHTVLPEHCTGCELCIPVCPVDCISLENASGTHTGWDAWSEAAAHQARERYAFHSNRFSAGKAKHQKPPSSSAPANTPAPQGGVDPKQALIAASLARARAARQTPPAGAGG